MVSNQTLKELQSALAEEFAWERGRLTAHRFLVVLETQVKRLNATFGVSGNQAAMIEAGVLQNSFPAFLLVQQRNMARASQWVIHSWQEYAGEVARLPEAGNEQALLDYDLAVHEFLSAVAREDSGRRILRRLMTHLRLSQDDAGRMLGVSGETVRRWERGQNRIPEARVADLSALDAALTRLESLFLPHKLPEVIRRRAELFEGERAIDLILRGRITQVAERYETALAYQG